MVHPVAKSIGMTLVYLTDGDVDLEAVIDFFFLRLRLIDDSNSKDIIDFFECYMFILHLTPNGVRALHTCFQLIFKAHLIEFFADRSSKLIKESVALCLRRSQLLLNRSVCVRVLITETKIL